MKIIVSFVTLLVSLNVIGQVSVDTLIINGDVYDGVSVNSKKLNVGICQEQICYLGSEEPESDVVIDAKGQIVTPGFIDPHTHSLEELQSKDLNANLNYRFQGVTTVFVGNDGEGQPHVSKLANQLEANGIGTNVAMLVGHNALRTTVMGAVDKSPTQNEMQQMKSLLYKGLEQGAFGFSSGLYYVPGVYSKTAEVLELTEVAAKFDVVYESHIRDEGSFTVGFVAAIEEFLMIVKEAKIKGHIAHIKALGVDVWGQSEQVIKMINKARSEGLIITADQYPWQASGTFLHSAVVPKWVMEGGRDATVKRLKSGERYKELLADITENIRKRGGAERLLITASEQSTWLGKNLKQIADDLKKPPAEAVVEMVVTEKTRVASFNMDADDVQRFMKQDWVVTSSDGTNGHPRKYASFPQKFQKYVLGEQLISVGEFVKQSSSKTADIFGIKNRGHIALGKNADINVISPAHFKAHADFSHWNRLSTGISYQWINGHLSIEHGESQKSLPGQVLLKVQTK